MEGFGPPSYPGANTAVPGDNTVGREQLKPGSVTNIHLGLSFGTAFPSNPKNGYLHYYPISGGGVWKFIYYAADSSNYKWQFAGGAPLRARVFTGTAESTSSQSYVTMTTPVEVALPLSGDYDFEYGAGYFQQSVANTFGYINVGVNGAPANDDNAGYIYQGANGVEALWSQARITGVTAGQFARCYYRSMSGGGGTVTANHRVLLVTPVRVSG